MDEHEQDRQYSSDPMNIKCDPARYLHHEPGADRIKYQPAPEEDQMPGLQFPRKPLTPHADGVEDQCERDQDC